MEEDFQELYSTLKSIMDNNGYSLKEDFSITESGKVCISTFACSCDSKNEKTLREISTAIFNSYGNTYETVDDLAKSIGILFPNWIFSALDDFDMSISHVYTDQWSVAGITNAYHHTIIFSIQFDVFVDAFAHAIILKLKLLNGDFESEIKNLLTTT